MKNKQDLRKEESDRRWRKFLATIPDETTRMAQKTIIWDVETSGRVPEFSMLDEQEQSAFLSQCKSSKWFTAGREEDPFHHEELWKQYQGLSDSNQITVIAWATWKDGGFQVESVSQEDYNGHKEREMLKEFNFKLASKHAYYCGHFLEFDVRTMIRRCFSLGLDINKDLLKIAKNKPWDWNSLRAKGWDTAMMMKVMVPGFSNPSLERTCSILQVPSPKTEMDGAGAALHWWNPDKRDAIEDYCKRDVEATGFCFLHLAKLFT